MNDIKTDYVKAFHRVMSEPFVILDTETTGLTTPEAVQIAILSDHGTPLLDVLLKPVSEIEPGASAIHGITHETVKDCVMFPDVVDQIIESISGKLVVMYNEAFDRRVLNVTSQLHKLPPLQFDSWCAMEAYAPIYGEWNSYYGNYKWQPLRGGDHTAMGDCRATLRLMQRVLEEYTL